MLTPHFGRHFDRDLVQLENALFRPQVTPADPVCPGRPDVMEQTANPVGLAYQVTEERMVSLDSRDHLGRKENPLTVETATKEKEVSPVTTVYPELQEIREEKDRQALLALLASLETM